MKGLFKLGSVYKSRPREKVLQVSLKWECVEKGYPGGIMAGPFTVKSVYKRHPGEIVTGQYSV